MTVSVSVRAPQIFRALDEHWIDEPSLFYCQHRYDFISHPCQLAALRAQGFVDEYEPAGDEGDASERRDGSEYPLAGKGERV